MARPQATRRWPLVGVLVFLALFAYTWWWGDQRASARGGAIEPVAAPAQVGNRLPADPAPATTGAGSVDDLPGTTGAPFDAEGTLRVIWGDPPPGTTTAPRPLYFLEDSAGLHRLYLPPAVADRLGAYLLSGHRVRANVARALGPTPAGSVDGLVASTVLDLGPATPIAAGAPITGHHPWVTILCAFPDVGGTPHSHAEAESIMLNGGSAPGLDHYWREVSFNTFDLQGSSVAGTGWYTLPKNRSQYGSGGGLDFQGLVNDCTGVADADVNFALYDGLNMMFNATLDINGSCNCSWGGASNPNRDGVTSIRTTWMAPWADFGTLAHELGHGFGLPHSSGGYGQTYNSQWDTMSSPGGTCEINDGAPPAWGCWPPQINGYDKDLLGLLPVSTAVFTPAYNTQQVVNLDALETYGASPGAYKLIKVPALGGAGFDYYTIELRRRSGYDTNSPAGASGAVVLHTVANSGRPEPAVVVDLDNDGDPNDCHPWGCPNTANDARWVDGETFVDSYSGLMMKVQALNTLGNPAQVVIRYGHPATTPVSLAFTQSPGPSNAEGAPFAAQPVVAVLDGDGLPVETNSVVVSLAIAPAVGTLSCTGGNQQTTVNGVATFAGCTITGGSGSYTLVASASGLPDAISPAFSLSTPLDCDSGGCHFDFDTDAGGFALSGLWHRETTASIVGMAGGMLAYNAGCTGPDITGCSYNTGGANAGRAVSPPLVMNTSRYLRVSTARQADPNCGVGDFTRLLYSTDGGATFQPMVWWGAYGMDAGITGGGQWLSDNGVLCGDSQMPSSLLSQTFGFTLPAGTTNIAFDFDTVDGNNNAFAGWFLDDVDISAGVPTLLNEDRGPNWSWAVNTPLPIPPVYSLRTAEGAVLTSDSSTSVTLVLDQYSPGPPPAGQSAAPSPGPGPAAFGPDGSPPTPTPRKATIGGPGAAPTPGGAAVVPGTLSCAGGLTTIVSGGRAYWSGCTINAPGVSYYFVAQSALNVPGSGWWFDIVVPKDCDAGQCAFSFDSDADVPYRGGLWHRESLAGISGMSAPTLADNSGCTGPGTAGCTMSTGYGHYDYAFLPLVTMSGARTLSFDVYRDVGGSSVCGDDHAFYLYLWDGQNWWYQNLQLIASISAGPLYFSNGYICGNSAGTPQTVTFNLPAGISALTFNHVANGLDDAHPGVFVDNVRVQSSPTYLAFTQQPTDTAAGQVMSPNIRVGVFDGLGALASGESGRLVTLSVLSGPAQPSCASGLTVATVNGEATFSNCTFSTAGFYGYLRATSSGLVDAVSTSFTIGASPSGTIQFAVASFDKPEHKGKAKLIVQRVGGASGAVSVQCATGLGSAVPGPDYAPTDVVLNWADGDASDRECQVRVFDDAEPEGTEAVPVALSNPTGGAGLGLAAMTLNILDQKTYLTTPLANSTLSGAAQSFQRSSGSWTQVLLWFGNTPGASDIAGYDMTGSTSLNATNLPTDGRTIYVRLWSAFSDGSWSYNDYSFAAAGTPAKTKALILSPVSGSTLPGAVATFLRTNGSNAVEYLLWVGSAPGLADISGWHMEGAASLKVRGLPVNGSTVYVRLWTHFSDNSYQYVDYTFTAVNGGAVKATIVSPTPGTTLPGASVTLTRDAGNRIVNYHLWIGSSPGTFDIRADYMVNTTYLITTMPTDGRTVYVRLWSEFDDGTFQYNDYVYTAAP